MIKKPLTSRTYSDRFYMLSPKRSLLIPPLYTMYSKISCFGIAGLDAYPITIEADITPGLPNFTIVGLPDNAVKESRERVRSAIKNSGFDFPSGRITVNLSPADTKKEGPAFDLAIALGVLSAASVLDPKVIAPYAFIGELSLDGSVLPINGTLVFAMAADPKQYNGLLVPRANAKEAALAKKCTIYAVGSLKEAVHFLHEPGSLSALSLDLDEHAARKPSTLMDFCDVKGQASVKRGLEVAAAGGHNVLLIGPPGSGKTMLAKRLIGILPDMSWQETLEVTKIHSVAGLLSNSKIAFNRPFRNPHHTASDIALIGGGTSPRPGEVSLAHHGILFLDELPEFNRHVLEVLRQPLEDHYVTVARAARTLRYPAQFMLVAAMNPCPCGFRMGGRRPCSCSLLEIERYLNKISGPLLDRIDMHLEVPALKTNELFDPALAETSAAIKKRTTQSRLLQLKRLANDGLYANSQMSTRHIKTHCVLNKECTQILGQAVENFGLSGRAFDKVLKIARTIADLGNSNDIKTSHLAEAISYRTLDRMR